MLGASDDDQGMELVNARSCFTLRHVSKQIGHLRHVIPDSLTEINGDPLAMSLCVSMMHTKPIAATTPTPQHENTKDKAPRCHNNRLISSPNL